jgi:hypothetical protein
MNLRRYILTLALLSFGDAAAAPWKNDTLGVSINLPKGWRAVTVPIADKYIAGTKNPVVQDFYIEVKRGLRTGEFALFENRADTNARADIQMESLGGKIPPLLEKDIRSLCPLWAAKHDPAARPFNDCQPRKLGEAWTAFLTMAKDPGGRSQYKVKAFRPDGYVIILTVDGTAAQAEAILKNTKFY